MVMQCWRKRQALALQAFEAGEALRVPLN